MTPRTALTGLLFLLILTAAGASGQLVNVTIETSPAGGLFQVDGQSYNATTVFSWQVGSTHQLTIQSPQQLRSDPSGAMFRFVRWVDSTGFLNTEAHTVQVIASRSLTWIKAEFARNQFPLRLQFFECLQFGCQPPGSITINGVVYTNDATVYFEEGTTIEIKAVAYNGYAFLGWGSSQPVTSAAAEQSFVMRGPVVLTPRFVPATPVDVDVSPPGLIVLADGVPHKAPIRLYWAEGTTHTISVPPAQSDQAGRDWVFARWEHGGVMLQSIKAGPANQLMAFRAHFTPGARVGFVTKPGGLRLVIDGSDRWPGYNFIWGVGSVHQVSAPLTQTDSAGRPYVFKGWEHGGAAMQLLEVPPEAEANGLRWIAVYEAQARLTIQSSINGAPISVDGKACETPCVVDRPVGSQVRVVAGVIPPPGPASRIDFAGWADGQPRERVWQAGADLPVWVAIYRRMHRLLLSVSPANAGEVGVNPPSPDGFYPEHVPLTISASPNSGYRFRRWLGAVTDGFTPAQVQLAAPAQLEALFERSGPRSLSVSVWNVVGPTPNDSVAPGSIISIYGDEIVPQLAVSATSPLPQTLEGVSVRVGGQLLGLLFVSPGQINAVLSSTLPEGEHFLEVLRAGMDPLTGSVLVSRNSPGLFTWRAGERTYGIALHENGKLVTPENPGKPGAWITLIGTGFGPLQNQWPDGFPAPEDPVLLIRDRVDVVTGATPLAVKEATAVPGQVGVHSVRFQVPEAIVGDTLLLIRTVAKDKSSNEVRIPARGG